MDKNLESNITTKAFQLFPIHNDHIQEQSKELPFYVVCRCCLFVKSISRTLFTLTVHIQNLVLSSYNNTPDNKQYNNRVIKYDYYRYNHCNGMQYYVQQHFSLSMCVPVHYVYKLYVYISYMTIAILMLGKHNNDDACSQ